MKPIVVLTVDMEFSSHPKDMGISGRVDGVEYGIPLFMRMLRKYNLKATFFTDVYINKSKYRFSFINLCRILKQEGHDLQLHTHPYEMFDCRRYGMRDYSLEEQIEIIKTGKILFNDWFGLDPVAHRAGDWAANYDTLEALRANNIYVDSSMFYKWRYCQLNGELGTKNRPVEYNGVLEVPASIFECNSFGVFSPYRLVSTDANSFEETWDIFKKLKKSGIPVINTVYHSFSFVKWNKSRTEYSVAHNRIRKFEMLLEALATSGEFEVRTIYDIHRLYQTKSPFLLKDTDAIPRERSLHSTVDRILDRLKG